MANYPLPAFHYQVEWGGEKMSFSEVSGLNVEIQMIEYRDGDSKQYEALKMPGIPKYGNLTMKKGILAADNKFFDWVDTTALNTVERKDIIISLLNEAHEPVMTWKAINAFPVKVEGPGLKSTGNEVAIESIEVAHEKLTIENG
ncbi:phage tail protein [Aliikangiella coralliicola]|uniref:Phage tail protein n=1 Tax=Aliikangiella coralliicola TaxID=2592383 RepID=A0A545UD94_9GAMM|nr:phage tail protein [Aliikangiella coralliicola]TQV87437.1 phage tail protein [Aliikangiella coralliicola]